MTGRTGQKMGGCWQGKRPARIASQRLPYLGRLRKVRGDGGALPVPSAKNRHEVQQSCPCPGPFRITEAAARKRFKCYPRGALFFGDRARLRMRSIQLERERRLY
jgi:hypothetical protein